MKKHDWHYPNPTWRLESRVLLHVVLFVSMLFICLSLSLSFLKGGGRGSKRPSVNPLLQALVMIFRASSSRRLLSRETLGALLGGLVSVLLSATYHSDNSISGTHIWLIGAATK